MKEPNRYTAQLHVGTLKVNWCRIFSPSDESVDETGGSVGGGGARDSGHLGSIL